MNIKVKYLFEIIRMNRISEFIKNKAYFGGYPSQDMVDELENNNVRHFINLTCDGERKISKYKTKYNYIHYPIVDHSVPTNWKTFAQLILKIVIVIKSIKPNKKIYIHCKGGHGRSGVLVACLLCYINQISPPEAISLTTKYHNERKEMKEKWRLVGSPQTRSQKHFVTKFFEPLYIYADYYQKYTYGFTIKSTHSISIKNFGLFPTMEAAFLAYKDPANDHYIRQLETCINISNISSIGQSIPTPNNWDKIKDQIMLNVLSLKINQHHDIKKNLVNTGLRPIKFCSTDIYWGMSDIKKNHGLNKLGIILMQLRNQLYLGIIENK